MKTSRFTLLAFVLALALASAAAADSPFGHFIGKFVAEFDKDGRKVTLTAPYGFVDPAGQEWNVPEGYATDGASVPMLLWALYPPFTGNYRSAAVIHDYYCEIKARSWEDTHRVFYYAMRAAEVDERTAKIMYGAVYLFGPRWGPGTEPGQRNAVSKATPVEQETIVKELAALVEKQNPDLDTLIAEAKRLNAKAMRAPNPGSD
ncbi:MAG TPA: DUF1353 domain-containing protein [Methyloceanibacter sp.]|nr:DUF1353 domain-containing protein [Methyloceanibacter sp.]